MHGWFELGRATRVTLSAPPVYGRGANALHGVCCFSGDGGLAISAQLNPDAVAIDSHGNIYVVDGADNRVRLLVPSGPSCSASASTASLSAAAAGDNLTVTIRASAACAWVVQSFPSWITYSGNAVGTGPATVTLVAAANSGAARSATVRRHRTRP